MRLGAGLSIACMVVGCSSRHAPPGPPPAPRASGLASGHDDAGARDAAAPITGPTSWMIDAPMSFDFSGGGGIQVVLVPPGEGHVCGKADGFDAFYARFRRAVRAKDWAAVASMMRIPQDDWEDAEGAENTVHITKASDVAAKAGDLFDADLDVQIARGNGVRVCDLGTRRYTILYGDDRLSPAVYVTRQADGAWRVDRIGHAPHDLW